MCLHFLNSSLRHNASCILTDTHTHYEGLEGFGSCANMWLKEGGFVSDFTWLSRNISEYFVQGIINVDLSKKYSPCIKSTVHSFAIQSSIVV